MRQRQEQARQQQEQQRQQQEQQRQRLEQQRHQIDQQQRQFDEQQRRQFEQERRQWEQSRNDPRWQEQGRPTRFERGQRLPPEYRSRQYVIDDWRGHGLEQPPRGHQWVQSGSDYLLIAAATGVIVQILMNR
jgi:Ni/Co efflux regulator RcnB